MPSQVTAHSMTIDMERVNEISGAIVSAAMEVHTYFGPGLLERVYVLALALELRSRGFKVSIERTYPVVYKGRRIDAAYRVDLEVEGLVLVEVKSVEGVKPVHQAQMLTYLNLSERPVGLLLNFNEKYMKHGIERFVGPAALTTVAVSD